MIKNSSFLISILFAFALTACGGGSDKNTATEGVKDGEAIQHREVSSQVAYINLDSLLAHYNMFIDMSAELEAKATKAENDITSRGRSLERAVASAQEKVEKGLVTRAQAADLEVQLKRQEQGFYEFRERAQQELGEENQVMMNNIYHSINSFVAEFNSDYRYGVILTTSAGTPILHADPQLDITQVVMEGLNSTYALEKAPK